MDLRSLKNLLGFDEDDGIQGRERLILPVERWQYANERVDDVGTTRLMEAARDGALECVALLLRCGVDVNARDNRRRRAIDYSVVGNHSEVTLLLLRWDSLLPRSAKVRLKTLIDQDEDIKRFFTDRDNFHGMLVNENPESVENTLKNAEDTHITLKYWVNSDGQSALYTAANGWKYDSWALLRAYGFSYATEEEKENVEVYEADESFHCAIGKYFVELSGCHVQKMVAKCKVYKRVGEEEDGFGETVDGYFKYIDGEEYTSDLLKCLQDDSFLEIIFDFSSEDVQCMHPLGISGNIYGLMDLIVNRIYVAAKETNEFDYSDVVSNLVHELSHKALAVVFENGGLPYRIGDREVEMEYGNVVKTILSNKHQINLDIIIQRALKTAYSMEQELIVRVPEMIAKYKDQVGKSYDLENGFSRLQRQVPELIEFYTKRVIPEIKRYIERNKTASKVVKSELLRNIEWLTAHYDKRVRVIDSLKGAQTYQHGQLAVMTVSNLKLGVSHLELSSKGVTFVDWTRYQSACDYFAIAMSRNEIDKLAIIWDHKGKSPFFCRTSRCTKNKCVARQLEKVVHRSILMVPKNISTLNKDKCCDYSWKDLSSETKKWIMEKRVNVGGVMLELGDIVGSINGAEAVESALESLLDADDLSMLIDRISLQIGRPLRPALEERGFELLRSHPECFTPRSLRVRPLEFSKYVLETRVNDAFVIMNALKSDVEEAGVGKVCVWDEKEAPDGTQCFILSREGNEENEDFTFRRIFEKLKYSPSKGSRGRRRDFVHFFKCKDKKYVHHFSLYCREGLGKSSNKAGSEYSGFNLLACEGLDHEATIIADTPGSGKSVFVNMTALELKKCFPKRFIQVVDLALCENLCKLWEETDIISNTRDYLYELIKMEDCALERKLFDLFCQARNKSIILFDGFDEVCPKYKEKVTLFLEGVIQKTKIRVCVTTRRHESPDLERRLSTLAYNFVPFTKADQASFLNSEWNASLKYLSKIDRMNKIESIISCLQSHNSFKNKRGIADFIENIKSLSEEGHESNFHEVNFKEVVEEFIERGKSTVEGELDFSETPLHAWMVAFVAFERNFNLGDFDSLNQIYKRFVELKIDLYSREKAKAPEYMAGDCMEALFKVSAYELLKKFSAFFFLDDSDYKLRECEIPHLLRIGVVAQRENSLVFVHRTFGEYLFSLWLLDNAMEDKVTKVWLSRVLLENRFQKVREFINNLLLSQYDEKSMIEEIRREWENPLSSLSGFDQCGKECLLSGQKCLYKSILECHEGIFQYVVESSKGDMAAPTELIFGTAAWDTEILDVKVKSWCENRAWNAFTFLGECMKKGIVLKNPGRPHSELDYLRFLPKLLKLIEKHELTVNLNNIISKEGFWWTGANINKFWLEEEGINQFQLVFPFLLRNNNVLGESLRKAVHHKDSMEVFSNSAVHAFDVLGSFLNSLLNHQDFEKLMLCPIIRNPFKTNANLINAWTAVVRECTVEKVELVWRYLEGKLFTKENKRKFLRRKDSHDHNAMFAACLCKGDPKVFPFVWELFLKEMGREECKRLLLGSLRRLRDRSGYVSEGYVEVLRDLMSNKFLQGHEASQFMHRKIEISRHHLLTFLDDYSPSVLLEWQDLIISTCPRSKDILGHMKDHYLLLARSCFGNSEWLDVVDVDFETIVDGEYREMLQSLKWNPLSDTPTHVDCEGYFSRVFYEDGKKIEAIRMKAYLVLLRRQFRMEEGIVGREELAERLRGEWYGIYEFLPQFIMEPVDGGAEEEKTRGFLVPYFFAAVSEMLSGEQVMGILLHGHYIWGNSFHRALMDGDREAFRGFYGVARRAVGEDATWRVHGSRDEDGRSVLEDLLREQGRGLFERHPTIV